VITEEDEIDEIILSPLVMELLEEEGLDEDFKTNEPE